MSAEHIRCCLQCGHEKRHDRPRIHLSGRHRIAPAFPLPLDKTLLDQERMGEPGRHGIQNGQGPGNGRNRNGELSASAALLHDPRGDGEQLAPFRLHGAGPFGERLGVDFKHPLARRQLVPGGLMEIDHDTGEDLGGASPFGNHHLRPVDAVLEPSVHQGIKEGLSLGKIPVDVAMGHAEGCRNIHHPQLAVAPAQDLAFRFIQDAFRHSPCRIFTNAFGPPRIISNRVVPNRVVPGPAVAGSVVINTASHTGAHSFALPDPDLIAHRNN